MPRLRERLAAADRVRAARGATDGLALAAGLAAPFAFSPFEWFWLGVLAPAVLFVVWQRDTPARAAWRGFVFGLGFFGVGVSWVYVSMHNFGNMVAPLAAFATLLLVAGLSLYFTLLGYVQARWRHHRPDVHLMLLLPALWVLFEWWRGWFLSGFPWINLGYSQVGTPLDGYAAWTGVYGVSLACAVLAGIVAFAFTASVRQRLICAALFLAVVCVGWLGGRVDWAAPAGSPIRVALVQGNVPLSAKWRPEHRAGIIQKYLDISQDLRDRQLIVWPEAAVPAYLHQLAPMLDELNQRARRDGTEFVFGVVEGEAGTRRYYNSVASVGRTPGTWRKQHLVPFGEYLPAPLLFRWLVDQMQIPMSDFSSGASNQPPISAAGQVLGVSVCYEDAFGEEVIRQLPAASLLVNVSEDAWFGDSFAPHQRVQMARMRALETARPMLRAANTGPSLAIDARGRVLASTMAFQPAVLRAEIQPAAGVTPYVRTGNLPVVLLVVLVVLVTGLSADRFRRNRQPA